MTLRRTQKVKALQAPLPVKKMVLQLNLEPGFYLLEIYFVESFFADFCIVLFDEKEIGCFGIPNNRMNSNNRSRNLHCNAFPFIFAPWIKFKKKVKQVKLNGASWHYFDEDLVFLPNRSGIYRIEISYEGKGTPHLIRTFALVESTQWRDNEFTFQAMLPLWTKKLPKNLKFTTTVALAGYKCRNVYPGKILRSIENKVLVEFEIGEIKGISLFLN